MRAFLFFVCAASFFSIKAKASEIYDLPTVSSDFKPTSNAMLAENMPPIMSQDTLAICYGFAASTLLTSENCRSLKVDNCSTLPSDKIFSPLGLARYSGANKGNGGLDSDYGSLKELGSAESIISSVIDFTGAGPRESCISLDKLLSKVGGAKGDATQLQLDIWMDLKEKYTKYRKLKKSCEKCAADYFSSAQDAINKNFELSEDDNFESKNDSARILKAFGQDTFDKALNDLVYPEKCGKEENLLMSEGYGSTKVNSYPSKEHPMPDKKNAFKTTISTIKDVLKTKRPLVLNDLCLDKSFQKGKCENSHALVIAGYRKVCKGSGETNCRDVLKVVNSYGESWQKKHDDGWIDAQSLLDRTSYGDGILTWLSDK